MTGDGTADRGAGAPVRGVCRTIFGAQIDCDVRDFIQRRIMLFGVWEPHVTAAMRMLVAPGDTAIDIGANIGYYSLLLSALTGPDGRVVAVEPNPAAVAALHRNIARNGGTNIRVVESAVGPGPATVPIYEEDPANLGMATLYPLRRGRVIAQVPVAPLVTLLGAEERAAAVLIKIDVEGAEPALLAEILDRLDAFPALRHVLVELRGPGAQAAFAGFADAGFTAWRVPNSYALDEYRAPVETPALGRIDAAPDIQSDILFSRGWFPPLP